MSNQNITEIMKDLSWLDLINVIKARKTIKIPIFIAGVEQICKVDRSFLLDLLARNNLHRKRGQYAYLNMRRADFYVEINNTHLVLRYYDDIKHNFDKSTRSLEDLATHLEHVEIDMEEDERDGPEIKSDVLIVAGKPWPVPVKENLGGWGGSYEGPAVAYPWPEPDERARAILALPLPSVAPAIDHVDQADGTAQSVGNSDDNLQEWILTISGLK